MNFNQWLKQAYGVDSKHGNAIFSVRNMQTAYGAGRRSMLGLITEKQMQIKQLQCVLDSKTKMLNQWISTEDALPEEHKECLVYPWTNNPALAAELRGSEWFYWDEYDRAFQNRSDEKITHWKYLKGPTDES